jgi:hypothetical protein
MSHSHTLTEHAQGRKQQRGISDLQIDLIRYFGADHYQKGGCNLSYIDAKVLKQLRCAIDGLSNVGMVKTPSERVATVLRINRRICKTDYTA